MKLTKETLKRIIKEELEATMEEGFFDFLKKKKGKGEEKELPPLANKDQQMKIYARKFRSGDERSYKAALNKAPSGRAVERVRSLVAKYAREMHNNLGMIGGAEEDAIADSMVGGGGGAEFIGVNGGLATVMMRGIFVDWTQTQDDFDNLPGLESEMKEAAILVPQYFKRTLMKKAGSFLKGKGFREE